MPAVFSVTRRTIPAYTAITFSYKGDAMLFSIPAILLCGAAFCILRVSSPSGSFPRPLSAEQEAACIQAMLRGDAHAREMLIEHNLRLVAHIVKKYYSSAADADDLISIGTIGLIKGVSTFNPEKNVRLATYISRCIENAILTQIGFITLKRHSINTGMLFVQHRQTSIYYPAC